VNPITWALAALAGWLALACAVGRAVGGWLERSREAAQAQAVQALAEPPADDVLYMMDKAAGQ
jgi:hypothetical protein